jgi:hypothetical protein
MRGIATAKDEFVLIDLQVKRLTQGESTNGTGVDGLSFSFNRDTLPVPFQPLGVIHEVYGAPHDWNIPDYSI